MFNQFVLAGKVYEINITDKFIILEVNKGFAMFNTNDSDLIKINLSNFPEEVLYSIDANKVVMAKGRINSDSASITLFADRLINMSDSIEKEE